MATPSSSATEAAASSLLGSIGLQPPGSASAALPSQGVLAERLIAAAQLAQRLSESNQGLRQGYRDLQLQVQDLQASQDELMTENLDLRERLTLLEAVVSTGRPAEAAVAAADPGVLTSDRAALLELLELRKENRLLRERLRVGPAAAGVPPGTGGSRPPVAANAAPRLQRSQREILARLDHDLARVERQAEPYIAGPFPFLPPRASSSSLRRASSSSLDLRSSGRLGSGGADGQAAETASRLMSVKDLQQLVKAQQVPARNSSSSGNTSRSVGSDPSNARARPLNRQKPPQEVHARCSYSPTDWKQRALLGLHRHLPARHFGRPDPPTGPGRPWCLVDGGPRGGSDGRGGGYSVRVAVGPCFPAGRAVCRPERPEPQPYPETGLIGTSCSRKRPSFFTQIAYKLGGLQAWGLVDQQLVTTLTIWPASQSPGWGEVNQRVRGTDGSTTSACWGFWGVAGSGGWMTVTPGLLKLVGHVAFGISATPCVPTCHLLGVVIREPSFPCRMLHASSYARENQPVVAVGEYGSKAGCPHGLWVDCSWDTRWVLLHGSTG